MVKMGNIRGVSKKSWIKAGLILMVLVIGVSGCGTSNTASANSTNQSPSAQGQSGQGQNQRVRNPALQAATEIRRLQNDSQNALTSDQKEKIKPILQELIKTTNPSQDFLQQKADAINAVLTDQQKSSLTQRKSSNGNTPRRNYSGGGAGNGTGGGSGTGGGPGGNQNGSAFNPQTIYQQVLDSLN